MSLRAACLCAPKQAVLGGIPNRCQFTLESPTSAFGLRAPCFRVVSAYQQSRHREGCTNHPVSGGQGEWARSRVSRSGGVNQKVWRRKSARKEQETLITAPESFQDFGGDLDDEHRTGEQKVHESSSARGVKKRAFMLTQALRDWPLDVNLDAELADGQLDAEDIDEGTVRRVMHYLAKTRANEILEEFDGLTRRENLPVVDSKLDDVSDAHRALNLFSWWQRRNPNEPQDKLVWPLLTCLAKANLREEIRIFSHIFSEGFDAQSLVQSMLIKAYYNSGHCEDAISTYKQMRADGIEVAPPASAAALLAMGALCYPGEELLTVFRDATWRGRFRPGALCYMLRGGVSVEQIRAIAHDPQKPHLKVADLVLALCDLGRQVEARALADEVLESNLGFGLSSTINLVACLERGGLVAEAQRLLEKCVTRQINVGSALQQLMIRTRDARAAVRTYHSIMRLAGWHHNHFFVHRDAIVRFAQMNETDGALKAYGEAMRIKNRQQTKVLQIGTQTYGLLINVLAVAGRGEDAEAVLADYYASRAERNETGTGNENGSVNGNGIRIGNGKGNGSDSWKRRAEIAPKQEMDCLKSSYSRLVGMYFSVERPEKIVDLVESMAAHKLWLSANKVERWHSLLKEKGVDGDTIARFESAMSKMKNYRLALNYKY